jgi:fucose permease
MLPSSREDTRLFLALLANFILFGVTLTIVAATVPEIIREFDWSYLSMGAIVSAPPVGYFLSTFLSGMLIGRMEPKTVLVGGLLLQSVGLFLFGLTSMVAPNLLLAFMIGIGQGSTEVVTNFCVVQMEEGQQSRLINLMHGALPVGAVCGPFLMGMLFLTGAGWGWMYRGLGLLTLGVAALLSAFSYDRFTVDDGPGPEPGIAQRMGRPLLLLLCGLMFLFVGAEMGVSSWISEYFVQVLGSNSSIGAWMVSVFWFGVFVGRVSVSLLYRSSRQTGLLVILGISSTVLLSVSLAASTVPTAAGSFLLSGLGFSAIYPVVTATAGHRFPEIRSMAIGTVASCGGVGSFLFPLLISSLAGSYGLRLGFWFCVGSSAAGVVLAIAARGRAESIIDAKLSED